MRCLTFTSFCGLTAFDVLGLGHSFARLHSIVRKWKVTNHTAPAELIDRVCDAVNHACCWYPKRVLCLQRSAVTTCLLRTFGVPADMVIGAHKAPFKAHSWVEVNRHAVNERVNVQEMYSIWERC